MNSKFQQQIFFANKEVNRFRQSVCELDKPHLRMESRAAANIRLKEIKKRRALFGNQTVVLLTNSCGHTNSHASNPPFLKHR